MIITKEYLAKMGITPENSLISDDVYVKIALWKEWYGGFVKKFHEYMQYNGKKNVKRFRHSLCMAKKISEDWAKLLINEKLEITTSNESFTEKVRSILLDNDFKPRANRLCELAFALGTGAFCEYIDSHGRVRVDFYCADMIYPISADNGKITECAFCSRKVIAGKRCIYIQAHRLINGKYVITNKLFNEQTKEAVELPEGIMETFDTGNNVPLFQIIMPNIVNNLDIESPMGISVYANAVSALQGVDLVYDSYLNEFRLGKKRVYVPVNMTQILCEDSGVTTPIFDDNDTEFYAVPEDCNDKLMETDLTIRANEHTEGLNTVLDVLSDRCGLGTGRYLYKNGGVKTATEVVSENSELFQSLRRHLQIIDSAIRGLVNAIAVLLNQKLDFDTVIDFDDAIIHDTDAEFAKNIQLVSMRLMAKWEFRAWWNGESEEAAKEAIKNIEQEDSFEEFDAE